MGEEKRLEYIKATIYTTTQGAEALSAALPLLGIKEFCVEDPNDLKFIIESKDVLAWDYIDEQPNERETRVTLWLDKVAEEKVSELRVALLKLKSDEQYGAYGADADFGRLWLDTEKVVDDWKDKYKESFRAFSPCEGIVVAPPWEPVETTESVRIIIDPGMAFGTGSHETTAMCLAKLKELIKPGDQVLDAGTGSGILAIASAILGADAVFAVEIDEDAAESAARNIEANGVSDRITLIHGDINANVLPEGVSYDLVTANLFLPIINSILRSLKGVLKDDGAMLLSGLLDAQEDRIVEALENEGLLAAEIVRNGEWLMVEARR